MPLLDYLRLIVEVLKLLHALVVALRDNVVIREEISRIEAYYAQVQQPTDPPP